MHPLIFSGGAAAASTLPLPNGPALQAFSLLQLYLYFALRRVFKKCANENRLGLRPILKSNFLANAVIHFPIKIGLGLQMEKL